MMLKRSETATAIVQDSWYLYYWDTILFLSALFNNLKQTFLSHSEKHFKDCWNRSLETLALIEISNWVWALSLSVGLLGSVHAGLRMEPYAQGLINILMKFSNSI